MNIKETVSLEINGKKYDFRFYEETREPKEKNETLCEVYCPLKDRCRNIPDPRHFVDPEKYSEKETTFNDFCLDPLGTAEEAFNRSKSINLTLVDHSGEIVTREQLLEILKKESTIEKCLNLGYLKKQEDDKFEFVKLDDGKLYEKYRSLSEEDRHFISTPVEEIIFPDFMGTLMPVPEDIEKYIKEVVENQ